MITSEQLAQQHREIIAAEETILASTTRPLVVDDYDVFVELRHEMDKIDDLVHRTAEAFGVSDPGAATTAALVLEMRRAVDVFATRWRRG